MRRTRLLIGEIASPAINELSSLEERAGAVIDSPRHFHHEAPAASRLELRRAPVDTHPLACVLRRPKAEDLAREGVCRQVPPEP